MPRNHATLRVFGDTNPYHKTQQYIGLRSLNRFGIWMTEVSVSISKRYKGILIIEHWIFRLRFIRFKEMTADQWISEATGRDCYHKKIIFKCNSMINDFSLTLLTARQTNQQRWKHNHRRLVEVIKGLYYVIYKKKHSRKIRTLRRFLHWISKWPVMMGFDKWFLWIKISTYFRETYPHRGRQGRGRSCKARMRLPWETLLVTTSLRGDL